MSVSADKGGNVIQVLDYDSLDQITATSHLGTVSGEKATASEATLVYEAQVQGEAITEADSTTISSISRSEIVIGVVVGLILICVGWPFGLA